MRTDIEVRLRNEKTVIVRSEDDVEDVLDHNAELRTRQQDRKSDLRHVASIPSIIYVKWLNEEWMRGNVTLKAFSKEMSEIVARKLRDPEWAYLRVDGPSFRTGWRK